MIKKLIFSAVALTLSTGGYAVTITPEEALARAGKSYAVTRSGLRSIVPELSFTKMTEKGAPAVYVFNNEEGGFLVLSADDEAYPVLGYSDSGQITSEDIAMNPALEWWLSEYARQIEYATTHNVSGNTGSLTIPSTRADYAAIAPMIKTKWDQGAPYYNQCPLLGVDRTYTGCVATAMAQVMKYWEYPEVGKGQVGYEAQTIGKRLSLNFAKKKFDWDNMLPTYTGVYDEAQEDAVAYLMKACGYAVRMDYGSDSSGALAMNIANGLKKYFKYDPNMLYTLRDYYPTMQWTEMIYNNLKDVGPVLYGGASMLGGGHSFICDGYDGKGMFHFNWGWSGMSDGYFSLDALNPDALGTGGGAGGGYNFTQDAILGIQPPTGLPEEVRPEFLTQMGSLGAGLDANEEGLLHFELWGEISPMWVNYNANTVKVGFGAIIEPQGDTPGELQKISVSDVKFSIDPGYGTAPEYFDPTIDLLQANLSDGVYKITIATYDCEAENPEWIPVKPSYTCHNFVILKKNGKEFEVVVDDIPGLGVEDAHIVGNFYDACPIKVKVKIVNNFDMELTSGFAPAFAYDNAICFLGESIMVTVPPHSSVIKEWTTMLYAMQGAPEVYEDLPLLFTFFDEMTYNLYTDDFVKEVTMKPNPGYPMVDYGSDPPEIENLEKVKEEIYGVEKDVYQMKLTDERAITVNANITLRSGYFNYPVYGLLLSSVFDEEGEERTMVENYSGSIMSLIKGKKTKFSTSLNLASCLPGKLYSIAIGFSYGTTIMPMTGPWAYLRILDENADVNAITDNSGNMKIAYDSKTKCANVVSASGVAVLEAYDLQGKKLASSTSGSISLEGLTGIVIIHALDNEGQTYAMKVHI